MNNIDWALIRSFSIVARTGSLSGAARELGGSQPTLSRDIHNLEVQTGLNLFRRTTRGLILTDSGHALVTAASAMGESAELFSRLASGLSEELSGDVRVSANEIVGVYLLPNAIAAFKKLHPNVNIEIVISNLSSSLSKRDADIALRMFRPTQPDLVARRLPDLEIGLFAHTDYLREHDEPTTIEEVLSCTLIGFDENRDFINNASELGYAFTRNHFGLRSDHLLAQLQLLRAGAGIGATHVGLAQHWPELVRILQVISLPPIEFWCVTHSDVQYNSRIRELMSFLSEWLDNDPYARALV
ncbi:MAG: LysR family transcriptional regulator [Proteobacteria bacterium]|nr:LysR family transcriptional regulator [Pseudomonadota bacterium]